MPMAPLKRPDPVRWIRLSLCACALLAGAAPAGAETRDPAWLGRWILNESRTQAIQPEQPESRNWLPKGRVSTSVSVGGIPLPRSGSKAAPSSSGQASDPAVLRVKELSITAPGDEQIRIDYGSLDAETLHRGDYRGARTSWQRKGLRTRYQSTQRKVEHRYELQDDGSLLVTTYIKPNRAKRRTYLQVFERPPFAGDQQPRAVSGNRLDSAE